MIALSIAASVMSVVLGAWHWAHAWLKTKALSAEHVLRLAKLEALYEELLADARRDGAKEALTKAYRKQP